MTPAGRQVARRFAYPRNRRGRTPVRPTPALPDEHPVRPGPPRTGRAPGRRSGSAFASRFAGRVHPHPATARPPRCRSPGPPGRPRRRPAAPAAPRPAAAGSPAKKLASWAAGDLVQVRRTGRPPAAPSRRRPAPAAPRRGRRRTPGRRPRPRSRPRPPRTPRCAASSSNAKKSGTSLAGAAARRPGSRRRRRRPAARRGTRPRRPGPAVPSPFTSPRAGRAPPRKAGSSIPKNRTTWAASRSARRPAAPSYTATTGPPPRSGVTTTSALPSPSRSAAATNTPPVNVASNAKKSATARPVAAVDDHHPRPAAGAGPADVVRHPVPGHVRGGHPDRPGRPGEAGEVPAGTAAGRGSVAAAGGPG